MATPEPFISQRRTSPLLGCRKSRSDLRSALKSPRAFPSVKKVALKGPQLPAESLPRTKRICRPALSVPVAKDPETVSVGLLKLPSLGASALAAAPAAHGGRST